ncbi:MAG: GDP-mannose 4,6-dehydratase [Acidimicrobiales bacterium]
MRALVTGASGFVGRHLVDHLAAAGDDVVPTDRHTGVDILDEAAVRKAVGDARPDVVYHLAAWSDVGGSWSDPMAVFRVNAEGTLRVLQASADHDVDRVVLVSSADVYGPVTDDELPLTEASPMRPASPYAASKAAADLLGLEAWLGHQLGVIRIRAFNHHGPGQTDRFVAAALAERVARNELAAESTVTVGNLTARRDFTDARDVVTAYRLLAERGQPGEAYNVCTGRAVPISEIAERLLGMASIPMRLEVDPGLARPVDVPVLLGDNTKLRTATGWRPTIPLETTLADMLDDARGRVRAGAAHDAGDRT